MTTFDRDPERARELGRKGGRAKAAARKPLPDPDSLTILDWLDVWPEFQDPSWRAWRAFLAATFGLSLTPAELAIYQRHTDRLTPPAAPVREGWVLAGRDSGKSRMAAAVATFIAVFRRHKAAPGEHPVVMVIASDKEQAGLVFRYVLGFLERSPAFSQKVIRRVRRESVDLWNGVSIRVNACSFRSVRGWSLAACIADELAFWRTEDGAAIRDRQVLEAVRPGLLRHSQSLLLCISSPYGPRGELHRAYARSYGQPDPRVLVWNADTLSMNPTVDPAEIQAAFAEDPAWAASEYGQDGHVAFRADVQALFDAAALRGCTVPDRRELPPRRGVRYHAFVDPSGGGSDSFTVAIAHPEGERAVLDCVREVRPPFSPEQAVRDLTATLRSYGLHQVTGDRYGGEWPRERFRRAGVRYALSERVKAELYAGLLPQVNSGTVELLDLPRLLGQLALLERRVAPGGRDSVVHPKGAHDDVANAVAGALLLALPVGDGGRGYNLVIAGDGATEYDRDGREVAAVEDEPVVEPEREPDAVESEPEPDPEPDEPRARPAFGSFLIGGVWDLGTVDDEDEDEPPRRRPRLPRLPGAGFPPPEEKP